MELVELCHVGGEGHGAHGTRGAMPRGGRRGHGTHEERLARETRFTLVSSVLTVLGTVQLDLYCVALNSTDCKTVVHVIIDVIDVHVYTCLFSSTWMSARVKNAGKFSLLSLTFASYVLEREREQLLWLLLYVIALWLS